MSDPDRGAPHARRPRAVGFGRGAAAGAALMLLGLVLTSSPGEATGTTAPEWLPLRAADAAAWLSANLGHSGWLFALVLGYYVASLRRLRTALGEGAELCVVSELDQLSDVCIHVFVGIGVIWTAVGMRSALQAALGDPGAALSDSAGSVLQKLVDGGILLALSTTIVGGVGGYLMRLAKTMTVGAALHHYYQEAGRTDLRRLLDTVDRIEACLARPNASAETPARVVGVER